MGGRVLVSLAVSAAHRDTCDLRVFVRKPVRTFKIVKVLVELYLARASKTGFPFPTPVQGITGRLHGMYVSPSPLFVCRGTFRILMMQCYDLERTENIQLQSVTELAG
jgi:hypothetical protein